MVILLTGSTGFVGRTLLQTLLLNTQASIRVSLRETTMQTDVEMHPNVSSFKIESIDSNADWEAGLRGCQCVIHAAARTHVMHEENALEAYRKVNVEGTLNLARQAAKLGVKRFVFISSIKVNGEERSLGEAYTPDDIPNPLGAYALSKYEAETGLLALSRETEMEVVIIRPPLVYGPGVKGNFLRMMTLLNKKIPLPLKSLTANRRSLVSIDNLVSLISTCVVHPSAGGEIFLASDGNDLSTAELCLKLRTILDRQAMLFPCSPWFLEGIAHLLKKKEEMMRLTSSLQVDISKSQQLLNWSPIEHVDDALRKTVHAYLNSQCTRTTIN